MGAPDVVSAFAQGIGLPAGPESAAFLAAIGDAAEKAWAGLGFTPYFVLRYAGREWSCRGNTSLGLLRIQGEPGGGCMLQAWPRRGGRPFLRVVK